MNEQITAVGSAIDDEAKDAEDEASDSAAAESPTKRSRTSEQTMTSTKEAGNSNNTGRGNAKINLLADKIVTATAAARSSIVGGTLVKSTPRIKSDDDPDKVAKERIISVLRATILANDPTDLEERSPAEITRFLKARPELGAKSIVQATKQRTTVTKDLEKVLTFLESPKSLIRVPKVSKKLKAIPVYSQHKEEPKSAVTQPAASADTSVSVAPRPAPRPSGAATANAAPANADKESSNNTTSDGASPAQQNTGAGNEN